MHRTIDSCIDSSYKKILESLLISTEGTVTGADNKPTYRVLQEFILGHRKDLEVNIGNLARQIF